MDIIYLTSFDREIYLASGKDLIWSFDATKTEGKLLVYYEKMRPEEIISGHQITMFDITNSPTLTNFLQQNASIIPVYLGGLALPCKCPNNKIKNAPHRPGCHYQWFNRNAFRWFRKIVALEHAVSIAQSDDIVVWVDADCFFKRQLTLANLMIIFGENGVFYFKSKFRPVLEGGIVGYNLAKGGKIIIDKFRARYMSGIFRHDNRWDDCYQLGLTLAENRNIKSIDLARRISGHSDVVCNSALASFFEHRKGRHGRILKIMK